MILTSGNTNSRYCKIIKFEAEGIQVKDCYETAGFLYDFYYPSDILTRYSMQTCSNLDEDKWSSENWSSDFLERNSGVCETLI
jgi:hypothetical protein